MEMVKTNIGVIIGRFQLDNLHEAHIELIEHVVSRHDRVIIFLGISPTLGTRKHPLDYPTRALMINEKFPDIITLPLHDQKSDDVWSNILDKKIREVYPLGSVTIYGSRDSFIPHYKGSHKTVELEPTSYVSATDIRNKVSDKVLKSPDFRAGVIYGIYNTFPTVYSTVDVAILNDKGEILLGQKPNETQYRFIGGFVDVTDESDEFAAKREAMEETGLELTDFTYICSKKIQDWRYRNIPDRIIMTRFFTAKYVFGAPQPNDDICLLKWFKLTDTLGEILVEEHRNLYNTLLPKLNLPK